MSSLLYFAHIISKILILIDKILRKIFKKEIFLPKISYEIEKEQYFNKFIDNKKIVFFCPSKHSYQRVQTLFTKEPETLNWIDNFQITEKKKIVFWDIGANIGLYSIYASIKFKNIEVVSFEPSTSSTRVLTRNISINNLHDKIKTLTFALLDKENIISLLMETKFTESSSNSFFIKYNQSGKILDEKKIVNKYNIYGTTADYLINNNIIKVPNYIKIDVDGAEHLILKGAQDLLKNVNLKEILIEMSPNNLKQNEIIYDMLDKYGFKKILSTNSNLLRNKNYQLKTDETLNVIFKRNS